MGNYIGEIKYDDYDDEPIYDEEPGEGYEQECWPCPEHEFILTTLRGENLNLFNPLQSELCPNERLEVDLRNKPKGTDQSLLNTKVKVKIVTSRLLKKNLYSPVVVLSLYFTHSIYAHFIKIFIFCFHASKCEFGVPIRGRKEA